MRKPALESAAIIAPIVAIILLGLVPLWLHPESRFHSADGLAEGAIREMAPAYQPWVKPLLELPGSETESLLFALQAAMGAAVIGYYFGWKRGSQRVMAQRADRASSAAAPDRNGHARP